MRLLTSLAIIAIVKGNGNEGEEYLQSALKTFRKPATIADDTSQRKIDTHTEVPPLSFGKKELAKLYQAAVQRGESVRISSGSGPHVDAAVYELNEDQDVDHKTDADAEAYYYYYYPRKVFMDELVPKDNPYKHTDLPASDTHTHHHEVDHNEPPHHQYHTHTHQHHISIIESKHPVEEKKKHKALEPLFMAISGFIGMSVMFVLSMLILPKFGALKSRGVKDSTDGTSILKVVYQAIDGYDCSERLSCEFGKATRAFNVHNNRIFKLLRRIGPAALSKRLYSINKYSNKKHKCAVIQCKLPGTPGNATKKG